MDSFRQTYRLGKLNKNLEADYSDHFITFDEFIYLCKCSHEFFIRHRKLFASS